MQRDEVVKNEVYFNNVKLKGYANGEYTEYRKPKRKKSDNFLSKVFGLNKFHEWFNKNIEGGDYGYRKID